jgi:serine/threonine protein kinase
MLNVLGSLDKLLFDSNVKLSEEHKIRLVRGIVAGMLHLHKHNIVHRDLAARNILLSDSGEPKISVLCFVSILVD